MKTSTMAQLRPWGVALVIASVTALLLATGAILFYRHEEQSVFSKRYEEISSVAGMKVDQLVAWRDERRRDLERNTGGTFIRQALPGLLANPSDLALRGKIQHHLQMIKNTEAYLDVIVAGVDGRVLLSASGEKLVEADERIGALVKVVVASASPVFGEFTSCRVCPRIVMDVAMALADEDHKPLAVLILRTDVSHDLFPLLKGWPTPSASAEVVLARRERENVIILSPHRNHSGPHLGAVIPLTRTELPVVQAALGLTGLYRGQDSRGVEVMSDLRVVPGSPWLMVAKIDRQEILAEAHEHGWFISGLTVLSFLMTATLAAFLYNYRQRHLFRTLYLAAQEKQRGEAALQEYAQHLAKLNRIYIMLKAVGQAIVRQRTPQSLYAEACRIAVEEGGFRMAWVGVPDERRLRVLPVANSGVAADYLEQLGIVLDEQNPRGQGPTGQAFHSGEVVAINDIDSDPRMGPWRESAAQLGYRASATFPLKVAGRVVATLNLYSIEVDCFDADEIQLLAEMVGDMAFALEFMEQEKRREAAEDKLRKFSRAVEQSPASMIITNLQGTIEYVNQKFLLVTGYAPEEVLGANPRMLKSGETPPEEYANLWQTISAGGEWHGEFNNRKKDGTLFWERVAISPIRNEEGLITNFLAIKEDITREKGLEEQLAQAQKMETVGRLAGGVAHDFNNMLGVILGCVELLLDRVPNGDPLLADLLEIRKAAERSAGLTRQLLAFARKQLAVPQILELNGTIASMLSMLQRLLGEDVSIIWRPDTDLWLVKIDPTQVDQILANLTVNAREALDRNGVLTITTANVVLDADFCRGNPGSSCGDFVMLTVSDNGVGMDQDTMSHIFEPFFTTRSLGQGTGLGLSTTYGIVKQNNGSIRVDSAPGVGTTFKIYLPRVAAAVVPVPDGLPHLQEPVQGSETVLLVEDEVAILELGERILCRGGYTVLTAGRATQALELAAAHPGPLHLLITDVVMPGMNGKELAEQLLARRPGVKVLFMSGYTADIIAHQGVQNSDIYFIEKPFSKVELLTKVRQMLDS